jgi:hypothetical protein
MSPFCMYLFVALYVERIFIVYITCNILHFYIIQMGLIFHAFLKGVIFVVFISINAQKCLSYNILALTALYRPKSVLYICPMTAEQEIPHSYIFTPFYHT